MLSVFVIDDFFHNLININICQISKLEGKDSWNLWGKNISFHGLMIWASNSVLRLKKMRRRTKMEKSLQSLTSLIV